jgi:hypothetical protein
VNATYKNAAKEQLSEAFLVSFLHFWDWTKIGGDPETKAAQALEKLADLADKLGSGWHRLHVEIMTQEDVAREYDERVEARRSQDAQQAASASKNVRANDAPAPAGEVT